MKKRIRLFLWIAMFLAVQFFAIASSRTEVRAGVYKTKTFYIYNLGEGCKISVESNRDSDGDVEDLTNAAGDTLTTYDTSATDGKYDWPYNPAGYIQVIIYKDYSNPTDTQNYYAKIVINDILINSYTPYINITAGSKLDSRREPIGFSVRTDNKNQGLTLTGGSTAGEVHNVTDTFEFNRCHFYAGVGYTADEIEVFWKIRYSWLTLDPTGGQFDYGAGGPGAPSLSTCDGARKLDYPLTWNKDLWSNLATNTGLHIENVRREDP